MLCVRFMCCLSEAAGKLSVLLGTTFLIVCSPHCLIRLGISCVPGAGIVSSVTALHSGPLLIEHLEASMSIVYLPLFCVPASRCCFALFWSCRQFYQEGEG